MAIEGLSAPTLGNDERNNERVDRLVGWRCHGMWNDRSRLRREQGILCQQLFDFA